MSENVNESIGERTGELNKLDELSKSPDEAWKLYKVSCKIEAD